MKSLRGFLRHGAASMALAVCLFFGGFLGAQESARPASGTVGMAHLQFDGIRLAAEAKNLALAAIWREPEVQQFVAPLLAMWPSVEAEVIGKLKGLGFGEVTMLELLAHRISITFAGLEVPGAGVNEVVPKGIVTIEGPRVPDLVKMLRGLLEGQGAEISAVPGAPAGVTLEKTKAPNGADLFAAHQGNKVSFSTQSESLIAALAGHGPREAMEQTAHYKSMESRCGFAKGVLNFYVDSEALSAELADEIPAEVSMILATMATGMGQLKALGYGMAFDGAAVVERSYALGMKMSDGAPPKTMAYFGPDTRMYSTMAISLPMLFKQWESMLSRSPLVGPELESAEAELASMLGFDLRKDLLPLLADETALAVTGGMSAAIPDVVLLQKITDQEKVSALLRRLGQSGPLEFQTKQHTFRGVVMNVMDITPASIDSNDGAPRPTWGFIDDYLFLTPWPQAARRFVASSKNVGKGLVEVPLFKDASTVVRGQVGDARLASMTYVDVGALTAFLHRNGAPLLQLFAPRDEVPLDFDLLPLAETVTDHLFPLMSVGYFDGAGAGSVSRSPTGTVSALFLSAFPLAFVGRAVPQPMLRSDPIMLEEEIAEEAVAETPRSRRDKATIATLTAAVELFRTNEGRLPTKEEWPGFLVAGSAKHRVPYIEVDENGGIEKAISDSRGRPFVYRLTNGGDGFEIVSAADAAETVADPKTPAERAALDLTTLNTAVKVFRLYEGRTPKESEWPAFLLSGSTNYPTPYVNNEQFKNGILDPWGKPYLYSTSNSGYEIRSLGADGLPGGTGDNADLTTKK